METTQTELTKIRQVAKEYEKNGYTVIIEPHGADIPSFITNYQPDLIAHNDHEHVIIEVKKRSDYKTIDKLRDIADLINKKENWRFELIVTSSKQENQLKEQKLNKELNIVEIENNLIEIKSVLELGMFSSAFILCWANLESLSRQLLLEDKKDLNNKSSLVLVKTLFSFGYVTKPDYEILNKLYLIRNQIVHGYKSIELDRRSVERLINITETMLREKR